MNAIPEDIIRRHDGRWSSKKRDDWEVHENAEKNPRRVTDVVLKNLLKETRLEYGQRYGGIPLEYHRTFGHAPWSGILHYWNSYNAGWSIWCELLWISYNHLKPYPQFIPLRRTLHRYSMVYIASPVWSHKWAVHRIPKYLHHTHEGCIYKTLDKIIIAWPGSMNS